jgi:hypothetical protein
MDPVRHWGFHDGAGSGTNVGQPGLTGHTVSKISVFSESLGTGMLSSPTGHSGPNIGRHPQSWMPSRRSVTRAAIGLRSLRVSVT